MRTMRIMGIHKEEWPTSVHTVLDGFLKFCSTFMSVWLTVLEVLDEISYPTEHYSYRTEYSTALEHLCDFCAHWLK